MHLKPIIFSALFILTGTSAVAQDTTWTLQQCVQYALIHNLDLNQDSLNVRMSKLQYNQTRLSQIPSLSGGLNYGRSFGRSIDPTSNQFIDNSYSFSGANANVDVLLFGWFSKRNSIKADRFTLSANQAAHEQLQDDISLNVATGFLRALLAKEQVEIAQEQVGFSVQQMGQTKAFVDAGRSPKLDLAQIKAQVGSDSAAYFSALNDYEQALYQLKALLNLDMNTPMGLDAPTVNEIPLTTLLQNSAEQIYETAKDHFGSIKNNDLQISAAQKQLAVQKALLYPQLSFGFQAGTNYASTVKDLTNPRIIGTQATGEFVDISGNQYAVMAPQIDYSLITTPFFAQLKNNFRQTAVLTLSIPVFNGWAQQTSVKQARINIQSKEIDRQKADVKLKQDIYTAYSDARTAVGKFHSAKVAKDAAALALNFAQQRYQAGLISTIDLLTTQNQAFKAESDAASAKYDLIFKLKVLDYYLGKPLNL